jgi:hypothetical protein
MTELVALAKTEVTSWTGTEAATSCEVGLRTRLPVITLSVSLGINPFKGVLIPEDEAVPDII